MAILYSFPILLAVSNDGVGYAVLRMATVSYML
jgi:hypothetical protein